MWEHHYSGSAAIDVDYVGIPDTLVSVGRSYCISRLGLGQCLTELSSGVWLGCPGELQR